MNAVVSCATPDMRPDMTFSTADKVELLLQGPTGSRVNVCLVRYAAGATLSTKHEITLTRAFSKMACRALEFSTPPLSSCLKFGRGQHENNTKECLHSTSMFETHFAIKNSRALGLEAAASAARQAARAATPAAVPMNSDAQGLN